MFRKTAVVVAAMLIAAPAWAFHCPQDMKQIDEAMSKNPKLSATQLAEVKKYRAEGEVLHKAGKHTESVAQLDKAKKLLALK